MLQANQQVIATIIAVVILLVCIGVVVLFLLIYYDNAKKRLWREKEMLKTTYEKTILQTQMEIREQTMQTIGADLHDNIGQLLSLTSLTLNSIELDNTEKAQQKIESAIELNLKSIKEMRLLGKLLHGEQLLKLGLEEAIRHEISWVEKSGKYKVDYLVDGERSAEQNADKDLILFRITQEILNNIIKHSQAKAITIKLEYQEPGIKLQVVDNGAGFNIDELTEEQKGMGLKNIQKRAEIVGGSVFIQSQPGEGTCVEIFIPYP